MSDKFINELNTHLLFEGDFSYRMNVDDMVHASVLVKILEDEPLQTLRDSIPEFDERLFKVLSVIWFPSKEGQSQYVELGLLSEN